MNRTIIIFLLALGFAAQTGCGSSGGAGKINITSSAFGDGETMPDRYTCSGENLSPPLAWSGVSEKVKAIAVICVDNDSPSGSFTHWMVYDLPASVTSLPEGLPDTPDLKNGGIQGLNSFDQIGYSGPCPPPGSPHRYFFRVIGLDANTGLESGAGSTQLLGAIRGHIVQEGQFVGLFGR
jgi:Raf kinase inhibitor-like YbhB/YbcL family protein